MKKYKVWIYPKYSDEIAVTASSKKEARDKAWNIFINRKKTRKLFSVSESEGKND